MPKLSARLSMRSIFCSVSLKPTSLKCSPNLRGRPTTTSPTDTPGISPPHKHVVPFLDLFLGNTKIVFDFLWGHVLKILFGHYCLLASPSSRRTLFVGGVKAWYISSTATYFR